MGYTTRFLGKFEFDRPLDDETYTLLKWISTTRRMKRQGLDEKYGVDGEFYFNPNSTNFGQEVDTSIADYNAPPSTQPGLWCQWTPTDDRTALVWDDGEKFYHYIEWLEYLIVKILSPRGYVLSGECEWQGEDPDDFGRILVSNNVVFVQQGQRTYSEAVRR